MFNYLLKADVVIAAQAMRFFASQVEKSFEEPAIGVTILEVFQKLGYDCLTQDQVQTAIRFVFVPSVYDSFVAICWIT